MRSVITAEVPAESTQRGDFRATGGQAERAMFSDRVGQNEWFVSTNWVGMGGPCSLVIGSESADGRHECVCLLIGSE